MSDDTFRQDKRTIVDEAAERKNSNAPQQANQAGLERPKLSGRIPPQLAARMNNQRTVRAEPQASHQQPHIQGSSKYTQLVHDIQEKLNVYDTVALPSLGKFYTGDDGPTDGVLHVRAMTGAEEQILASPRFVKSGAAIDMIFRNCINVSDKVKTHELLSVDRNFLLIYLRGISYGNEYDVEVKCPECDKKFNHTIDLGTLMIENCPEWFHDPLTGTLPVSGLTFNYRLSRGIDEQRIQRYRDNQLKDTLSQNSEDVGFEHLSMLLHDIGGLTTKNELKMIMAKLSVQDLAYLRNEINNPPFGTKTKCPIICASCYADFDVNMPLEANFFSPKPRPKEVSQG